MKKFPLSLKTSSPKFIEIDLSFVLAIDLLTPELVLAHAAEISSGLTWPRKPVEARDARLRVSDLEADAVAWLLEITTSIFEWGEHDPSNMAWRRFLHFLLEQQTLPIAETAADPLVRRETKYKNKSGRINFDWPGESKNEAAEHLAIRASRVGDNQALLVLEYRFAGPTLSVLSKVAQLFNSLVNIVDSGSHPVEIRFNRSQALETTALQGLQKLVLMLTAESC